MEVGVIVELISTLGFPIAIVVALGFFFYKVWQQSVDRENALREQIKEGQTINQEAIKTLTLYAERLDSIQSDVEDIKKEVCVIATG